MIVLASGSGSEAKNLFFDFKDKSWSLTRVALINSFLYIFYATWLANLSWSARNCKVQVNDLKDWLVVLGSMFFQTN